MATEKDIWTELRKPFPAGTVGKLPKPTISNEDWKRLPKGKCNECGGYHATTNTIHLDFVGHANVTDRLNTVDPTWTWEPVAFNEQGLPAYDNAGGLWIRLSIGGVTRLGYGDGPDPKQRIGDALRNAAMRFGVALDLWSKDELESNIENPENKNIKATAPAPVSATRAPVKTQVPLAEIISKEQVMDLMQIAKMKGHTERAKAVAFLNEATGLLDFTAMPADEFDLYKKRVTTAGWSKPDTSGEVPF